MYVRYGGYTHALAEAGVSTQKTLITQGGLQVGVEETWTINGFLQAASQAALITAITALEIAYGTNNRTLQLLLADGSTVARQMPGVHVLGGTEVIAGPSFPVDGTGANGAEFVGHRTYTIQVRGRYSLTAPTPGQLASYTESIRFSGGGPRRRMRENLYGTPRGQTLVQKTIYRAVQQGSAIGLIAPPTPPAPLWPESLTETPEITVYAPKRGGSAGSPIYTEHQVDWLMQFESAVPLLGRPNYWR